MEGACVVGAECVDDQECVDADPRKTCNLETFTCDFREGFGDECDATHPCPFGEFCSTLLGRCLEAGSSRDCTRRAQCPSNQICDRQANKCIPDPGCYGDQFCEDGEICDLVNHTCRALAVECVSCAVTGSCDGDALCAVETKECLSGNAEPVCRQGEECDPLGRCVQCTTSDQCGPGLFCNVAIGRCESNIQCAEDPSLCPDSPEVTCVTCEAPEVCDPRTKRCQAPPTICENDIECPNDQVCDLSVDPHICVPRLPDCLNDLLEGGDGENNNSLASAYTLPPDETSFEELKVCQGDIDWYRLDVAAGTYLTVDARFEHLDGDLELQLFLPDGTTLVDQSRSVTDNERVELEVGTDLTLYLKVFLAVPTVREVPYRLVVARDPGTLCMDDDNEPDDGPGDAKQLLSDMPYEGRICPADPDWFVLRNVPPATRITASLQFVDNLGDLDLEIYRAGQTSPLLVADSMDDDESLTFDASYGGDYFVRVVGKSADTNVYTLRAELREGMGMACLDDMFESNDGPTTPTSTTGTQELTLCAGDEDWFQFHLEPGQAVSAEIGFEPNADLDMKLYPDGITDPNVSPLLSSVGTFPREFIATREFLGGDFLLRVYGHDQQAISPYELDLRIHDPFVCAPDEIDDMGRGDSQMDPFTMPFPPFRRAELTLCGSDDDWFRIFLPSGFSSIIRINYIGDDATLDFQLWQGTTQIFTSFGQPFPNHREVQVTLPGASGQVTFADVHVINSGGTGAEYSFTYDLVPVFGCPNDPYEPNNNRNSPTATSSTASSILIGDGTLCASVRNIMNQMGDEDWYLLTPPSAGARINADLTFQRGDLLLELFSPGAVARACVNSGMDRCYSDGNNLSEMVSFTATTTDPYLLRVSSIWSEPNALVRPPDIDTPYELLIEYQ